MKNKEYHSLKAILGRAWPAKLPQGMIADSWARAAAFLGVAMVGTAFAQLTWRLLPLPDNAGVSIAVFLPSNHDTAHHSLTELTDSHLFGTALTQPGGAINAPETTLNLTLRGIFALDNARALAIIASGDANELPYKAGDHLPGGALVHEIAPDKVILERSGRFETLTLPRESLNSGKEGTLGLANSSVTGPPSSQLIDMRNRLRGNPAEAVGMNAVQPVMENGHLKGYQLENNPYMPVLREAGLMPGDVVTRVNGIAATDQARAAEMLNQLSNAGRVDLEVERGGVATTLSVNLGK